MAWTRMRGKNARAPVIPAVTFKKEKLMIRNKEIARSLSELMLEIGACLNDWLYDVQDKCDKENFKNCKRAVGSILGTMSTEVLNPLYREHPDIKPEEYYLPGISRSEK